MLFDKERPENRLRVALLGSASMHIQTGLTETLAGRFERTVVPHWSFSECRRCFDWNFDTGTIISGSDSGPFEISWNTPGDKVISLLVERNNCESQLVNLQATASELNDADLLSRMLGVEPLISEQEHAKNA